MQSKLQFSMKHFFFKLDSGYAKKNLGQDLVQTGEKLYLLVTELTKVFCTLLRRKGKGGGDKSLKKKYVG